MIPPPVPPGQNAVSLILNSLTNLENKYESIAQTNPPAAMREVLPGKAMVGWQQPQIVGFDDDDLASLSPIVRLWTNSWEDLGEELAAAKSDLDGFQSLTNHPVLDFNLDYENGYSIQLRHLARLKLTAQWLSANAVYNLHERRTTEACADVHTILAIVKGQTKEPLEISQLVRTTIVCI